MCSPSTITSFSKTPPLVTITFSLAELSRLQVIITFFIFLSLQFCRLSRAFLLQSLCHVQTDELYINISTPKFQNWMFNVVSKVNYANYSVILNLNSDVCIGWNTIIRAGVCTHPFGEHIQIFSV